MSVFLQHLLDHLFFGVDLVFEPDENTFEPTHIESHVTPLGREHVGGSGVKIKAQQGMDVSFHSLPKVVTVVMVRVLFLGDVDPSFGQRNLLFD
jgi:hypothetical protein